MRLAGIAGPPERRAEALARVGAIVEEPRFHPFLTARENLEIVAAAERAGPRTLESTVRSTSSGSPPERTSE